MNGYSLSLARARRIASRGLRTRGSTIPVFASISPFRRAERVPVVMKPDGIMSPTWTETSKAIWKDLGCASPVSQLLIEA